MPSPTWSPTTKPPPKVPVNKETLRQAARLFAYLLPYKGKFFAAMFALLCSSCLGLMFPFLIGSLFNAALGSARFAQLAGGIPGMGSSGAAVSGGAHSWADSLMHGITLNQVLGLLVCQLLLQSGFGYMQVIWFNEVGEKALVNIRRDTYSRLIALPMSFFAQRRVGELASRISADLTQIEDTLTGATPQFLRQTTLLLGSLTFIIFTSGRLTLVMLSCFPPIIVVAIVIGRKMRSVSRLAQDKLAESNTVVEETLQGIANVKAFANEAFEIGRYSSSIEEFLGRDPARRALPGGAGGVHHHGDLRGHRGGDVVRLHAAPAGQVEHRRHDALYDLHVVRRGRGRLVR